MLRFVLLALALALAACGAHTTATCHVDADCASGSCDPLTLTCAPLADAGQPAMHDAGQPDQHDAGLSDAGDSMQTMPDAGSSMTNGCLPNNDGIIERAEVPLQAGLHAKFRVASNATFDTAGTTNGDSTTWDFTKMLSGDQDVEQTLQDVSGQWFANSFPSATYATQLSQSSDLLGIFQLSDKALLLLGVASPSDGFTSTKLTYDPPVTVLQFPFKPNDHWTTTSTVTGTAQGVAAFYTETYTTKVDKAGTAKTPYASFPVLRVSTVLDRQVGALFTEIRQFAFVTDCFGTIATISSQDDETQTEFTDVAEIQRLTP